MKIKNAQELIHDNLLVKHLAGSYAYGTATLESDVDYRGIFVADAINIRTPFFSVFEVEDSTEEDTKFYELAHFMKLCLDCNPNIVELLWTQNDDIVLRTPGYDLLRQHRHRLLSSKIAFTTSGYALAQLKRIKGHNKWIMNPQSEQAPRPIEYVSMVQWFDSSVKMMPRDFDITKFETGYRLVPYGDTLFGLYPAVGYRAYSEQNGDLSLEFDGDRQTLGVPLAIVKWNREEYVAAKERHAQYWNWKKSRNETRSVLEEQFGFDTKHALHLVRLLRTGVEALRDGEILVKRPDADELLAIRNGAWTYEELVSYAEKIDDEIKNKWYKTTSLPKKPDIKFAAELLMDVQNLHWKKYDK